MRIILNSIEAELVNISTNSEDIYSIPYWIIDYEVLHIDPTGEHSVRGRLKWTAVPDVHKILKFLKWFYAKRNTNIPEPTGEAEGTENTD